MKFTDILNFTLNIKKLFYLQIFFVAVALLCNVTEINYLYSGSQPPEIFNQLNFMINYIALSLYFICCAVLFIWIYRASSNTTFLNPEKTQFTPLWSVGWFFIPVFNLWKPYFALKEIIFSVSKNNELLIFLKFWWGLNIFKFLLNFIAVSTGNLLISDLFSALYDINFIIINLLTIKIITGVAQMQTNHPVKFT